MLIYFTFLIILTISLTGLMIDGGRWLLLKTQVTYLALSAAQAGAVLLDGEPGSVDAARDRANDMVTANSGLLENQSALATPVIRVCSNLAVPCATTADPEAARYIQVSLNATIAAAFVVQIDMTSGATATAAGPPRPPPPAAPPE